MIAAMLGHSRRSDVVDRYAHLYDDAKRRAAAPMDHLFPVEEAISTQFRCTQMTPMHAEAPPRTFRNLSPDPLNGGVQ